jgi:hypothetical protein
MKSFRFDAIWLLSRKDQRALLTKFHPRRNLLSGRNHTGKSTIIKNLFETLGAHPQGELSRWDTDAVTAVDFSVDGTPYRALSHGGLRALFRHDGRLIVATRSHTEWAAAFADVTGFNLVLSDKNSKAVPADPSCFFLPFYVNQDGSWQGGWDTFKSIKRFASPATAILEYFSGVKPPEYYDLRARRDAEAKELEEARRQVASLAQARTRLEQTMSSSGPKLDPKDFDREISLLTAEVTQLNRRQEELRDRAVREQELISSIADQIRLTEESLRGYESDSRFIRERTHAAIVCPTCGAEHAEPFLDALTYAEDARVARELAVRLQKDAQEASLKRAGTDREMQALDENYQRVSSVLDVRRGELRFGQVVESLGAESAFRAFDKQAEALQAEVDKKAGQVDSLDSRLKELTSKERSKAILTTFRTALAAARDELNLPSINTATQRLPSRPNVSGSGGPRSILAYYSALWRACHGEHGSFSIPLVIDSPNQQGQDDVNLPKVIRFIAERLEDDNQLIVGLESETDYEFDNTVRLTREYNVLGESDFPEVSATLEPLLATMVQAVLSP